MSADSNVVSSPANVISATSVVTSENSFVTPAIAFVDGSYAEESDKIVGVVPDPQHLTYLVKQLWSRCHGDVLYIERLCD